MAIAAAALPSSAFGLAAPTAPLATPLLSSVATRNISWTAPVADPGCGITGYEVTVRRGATVNSGPTAVAGTSTTISLTGGDGTFTYTVHAVQGEPTPIPIIPTCVLPSIPGPGNESVASPTMTLDTTPPGVTISGGPSVSPTNATGPFGFTIATLDPTASISWTYSGTPASGATGTATVNAPSDGTYTLTAKATDAALNASTISRSFTIDRTPPPVPTISGGPGNGSLVNAVPPGYSLSSSGAVSFTWTLAGPSPKSATTGGAVALGAISDGNYSLTAVARDALGNQSANSAARTFTLDRIAPPAPSILGIADGAVVNIVPSFDLGNSEVGVDFSWTLSGPANRSGASDNVDLSPLPADGAYTLRATVKDGAGNTSNEATRTFRLDRQAPSAPTITPEILSVMNAPPVTTIAGGGEPVSYRWQLDGGPAKTTTAVNLTGLSDGDHTLVAWSIDAAGNESARTNRPFKLDRLAPDPPQVSPVGAAVSSVPSVTITAARGTTISWALTGARALSGQGVSPLNPSFGNLPDGEYTLVARARTAAGNTSAPTTVNFRIDTQAPSAPAIMSGPASDRGGPKPSFVWAGEAGGSFVWQITRGDLVVQGPSTTPERSVRVAELLTGRFIFHVQQLDAAGNLGPESQFAFAIRNRSVAGKVAGRPLLAAPYGQLFPKAGHTITGRSQLVLSWAYPPGKKSRLFNVQVFDENGKKIHSAFPRKNRFRIPAALAKPGRRLYWQVWPYWGTRGYARKPLGVSYVNISRKLTKLAAER